MRPSMRRREVFWSSMKTAETMPVAISASPVCTMRPFSACGTYRPRTWPVPTGTSAARTTETSPPSSRLRSSGRVPRTLKRSSAGRPTRPSGRGRYSMTARGSKAAAPPFPTRSRVPVAGSTAS